MFGFNKIKIENAAMETVLVDSKPIIDVREPFEFQQGHVPNAKNIPMFGLLMNTEQFLNKDETYYVICQSGNRSYQVCAKLAKQGYHVVNVIGGTNEYIQNCTKK